MEKEVKEQIAELVAKELPSEITITERTGKALDVFNPERVVIAGVIDSPADWIEKRLTTFDHMQAHLIVDREKLRIKLRIDENNHFATEISGSLTESEQFIKFGINKGDYITNFEMANLFKMNRTCFETQATAMKLVSELMNFKAKVERDIEKADNNRGDRKALIAQTVQSNLPDRFNLYMPVFKGTPKQSFEVEVYVNANDFSCTIISPEANDIMEELRDKEIDRVLDRIKEMAPAIAIIEI